MCIIYTCLKKDQQEIHWNITSVICVVGSQWLLFFLFKLDHFFITACIISQIAGSRELGDGVDANIQSVNP